MHWPFSQLGFLQAPSVVCRGPSEAINYDYLLTILYRRSLDGCLVAQKVLGVNGDANAFSHFLSLFEGVAQVLSLGQDAEVSYRIIRKHRLSTTVPGAKYPSCWHDLCDIRREAKIHIKIWDRQAVTSEVSSHK